MVTRPGMGETASLRSLIPWIQCLPQCSPYNIIYEINQYAAERLKEIIIKEY